MMKKVFVFGLALLFVSMIGNSAIIYVKNVNSKYSITPGDVLVLPNGMQIRYLHFVKSTGYIIVGYKSYRAPFSIAVLKNDTSIQVGPYKFKVLKIFGNATTITYISSKKQIPIPNGLMPLPMIPDIFDVFTPMIPSLGIINAIFNVGTPQQKPPFKRPVYHTEEPKNSNQQPNLQQSNSKPVKLDFSKMKSFSAKIYQNEEIVFEDCGAKMIVLNINDNSVLVHLMDNSRTTEKNYKQLLPKGETVTLCNGFVNFVVTKIVPNKYIIIQGPKYDNITYKIIPLSEINKKEAVLTNGNNRCFDGGCVFVRKTMIVLPYIGGKNGYLIEFSKANSNTPVKSIFLPDDEKYAQYMYVLQIDSHGTKLAYFNFSRTSNGVKVTYREAYLYPNDEKVTVLKPVGVKLEAGDTVVACDGNVMAKITAGIGGLGISKYFGIYNPKTNILYPSKWSIASIEAVDGSRIENSVSSMERIHPNSVIVIEGKNGDMMTIKVDDIKYTYNPNTGKIYLIVDVFVTPSCGQ